MLKDSFARFSIALFAFLAVTFILSPRPAAANTVTLDFSGSSCAVTCGTITGSFQFTDNGTTDSIGAWSFNLSPVGLSNISGASGSVYELSGYDSFAFISGGTALGFSVSDPSDLASSSSILGNLTWPNGIANVSSVDVTQASATPEPSSLLLLGTGLLGLGPFIRRFAHS